MKRTKIQQNKIKEDKNDKMEMMISDERPKLNLKSLRSRNIETVYNICSQVTVSSKKSRDIQKEIKRKIHVKRENEVKKLKSNMNPGKWKIKTIVDMQMMKAELSQLEDPPMTLWEKKLSSNRLLYEFFNTPCEDLAQKLLGKVLVRYLENGTILKGRIVETEGYLGTVDKASHSYQNKITPRNLPMYMPPGTIYVYMTYGMYHCFNISSQGDGCAVLVRAVDPLEGMEHMADQRNILKTRKVDLKQHELCNGPSKLCMAYQINKQHSRYSVCTWKSLWIEDDNVSNAIKIVKSTRIGIDSCGLEWANKPLRYYVYGNKSVSKRDKKAEAQIF
ncbi:DNA-3-methyladenine glycosylase-like isoform X1 [Pogonomyrmex barbatus]|uniref:DNA-3-methyladenine glycosylase n=1 Tax=Pogonomyrmex barbatus TaxID=144034 RepID=A0A8N1S5G4_9HYME|nr:DNA-3-methyladenine glycosylase-like isoform X1 [Pogonomyrmex barbatus]